MFSRAAAAAALSSPLRRPLSSFAAARKTLQLSGRSGSGADSGAFSLSLARPLLARANALQLRAMSSSSGGDDGDGDGDDDDKAKKAKKAAKQKKGAKKTAAKDGDEEAEDEDGELQDAEEEELARRIAGEEEAERSARRGRRGRRGGVSLRLPNAEGGEPEEVIAANVRGAWVAAGAARWRASAAEHDKEAARCSHAPRPRYSLCSNGRRRTAPASWGRPSCQRRSLSLSWWASRASPSFPSLSAWSRCVWRVRNGEGERPGSRAALARPPRVWPVSTRRLFHRSFQVKDKALISKLKHLSKIRHPFFGAFIMKKAR